MVDQEEEPFAEAHGAVDRRKRARTLERRARFAGVVAQLPCGDEAAQVPVAHLVAHERDQATGTTGGVADLRSEQRTRRALETLRVAQELGRARERVDVRQREGREPQLPCPLEQHGGGVDAGEEGVPAVDAKGGVHV